MYNAVQSWKVKKGEAIRFCEGWRMMLTALENHFGKVPYRLQRNCDGTWVTETYWPDQRTWQDAVSSLCSQQPEGLRVIERVVQNNVPDLLNGRAERYTDDRQRRAG